jgi:hypothetical protein
MLDEEARDAVVVERRDGEPVKEWGGGAWW